MPTDSTTWQERLISAIATMQIAIAAAVAAAAGSAVGGAVTQSGVWAFFQGGHSFQNITTTTTTVVKSGAGVLRSITINALGTVASLVTIYDNTAGSGSKIGTINSLLLSGAFQFDIAFANGLTIVTTGAPDITVSYR